MLSILVILILTITMIIFFVRKQSFNSVSVKKEIVSCECLELQTSHPGRVEHKLNCA